MDNPYEERTEELLAKSKEQAGNPKKKKMIIAASAAAVVIVAIFAIIAISGAHPNESYATALEMADKAVAEGDYTTAIAEYQTAIDIKLKEKKKNDAGTKTTSTDTDDDSDTTDPDDSDQDNDRSLEDLYDAQIAAYVAKKDYSGASKCAAKAAENVPEAREKYLKLSADYASMANLIKNKDKYLNVINDNKDGLTTKDTNDNYVNTVATVDIDGDKNPELFCNTSDGDGFNLKIFKLKKNKMQELPYNFGEESKLTDDEQLSTDPVTADSTDGESGSGLAVFTGTKKLFMAKVSNANSGALTLSEFDTSSGSLELTDTWESSGEDNKFYHSGEKVSKKEYNKHIDQISSDIDKVVFCEGVDKDSVLNGTMSDKDTEAQTYSEIYNTLTGKEFKDTSSGKESKSASKENDVTVSISTYTDYFEDYYTVTEYSYDLVQLSGSAAGIDRINDALYSAYRDDYNNAEYGYEDSEPPEDDSEEIESYSQEYEALEDSAGSYDDEGDTSEDEDESSDDSEDYSYDEDVSDSDDSDTDDSYDIDRDENNHIVSAEVTYNRNGLISIRYEMESLYQIIISGATYDVNTGEQVSLNSVLDGSIDSVNQKAYELLNDDSGYSYSDAADEAGANGFYIRDGKVYIPIRGVENYEIEAASKYN